MNFVNENCDKDPLTSMDSFVVNLNGDMACCEACEKEYYKQRDHFLNVVIQDDDKYNEWVNFKKY